MSALQVRAIGLIEQGKIAAAQRTLRAGWKLLMATREQHEPDARFQLQLGYLHKTIAQAFDAAGKRADADRHMALAAGSFAYMEREGEAGALSPADLAGALNGLGNVHSYRGESTEAIQCYRRAVQLLPGYAYAWHDLLLELLSRKHRRSPDLKEMEHVLDRLRATGRYVEGLGDDRIAWFEREVAKVTSPTRS